MIEKQRPTAPDFESAYKILLNAFYDSVQRSSTRSAAMIWSFGQKYPEIREKIFEIAVDHLKNEHVSEIEFLEGQRENLIDPDFNFTSPGEIPE